MRCAFDMSIRKIYEVGREEEIPIHDLLQLRTPLTQYAPDALNVIPYILDNGAFSLFEGPKFAQMAHFALADPRCLFVVMPDIVGDHHETMARFTYWYRLLDLDEYPRESHGDKLAFVAQDGCSVDTMPDPLWDLIGCLFIGGTDSFKEGQEAFDLIEEAQIRNKWVHVGRVNTPRKIVYFHGLADSFDGSGIARFRETRHKAAAMLRILDGTTQLRFPEWVE
jgi:hypothetical protein